MQDTTRLNYDELTAASKKFHNEGDDYAELLSSTRLKLSALQSEWEGEAAEKFFDEMEGQLLPAIKRLSFGLISAQDVLVGIMKAVFEADQETASYFKNLGPGAGISNVGLTNAAQGTFPGGLTGTTGDDFGAGKFKQASIDTPSETTDHFKISGKEVDVFKISEDDTEKASSTETPVVVSTVAGGGGGGGAGGSSGLQGDLKNLGLGATGTPAGSVLPGSNNGSVENLPGHNFGGVGSSGELAIPSASSPGSGQESIPAGSPGSSMGAAAVAAAMAAAKIMKDRQNTAGN